VTASTLWLGRFAVFLLVLSLLAAAWQLFAARDALGRRVLSGYEVSLGRKLRFLRISRSPRKLLLTQSAVVLGALSAAVALDQPLLGLLAALAVVLPGVHLDRLLARRATQVEAQIEPWLNAVAGSLRASPSLGEAIASSVALVPAPMAEEVDVLVKEYELGTPLDSALDHLAERVPSRTLAGTTLALKVARKSGGNLPEMLESAAVALRELARLEGVVRTKTAEGKAQAVVIGVVPLPLILLIQYTDPHFFDPLLTTFTGHLVLAAAAALWLAAVLMARKILQVDV
jgi:tight adherence protein B